VVRQRRRGWWRGILLLALACASPLVRCDRRSSAGGEASGPAAATSARVVEVTDGDTIVVELPGGRVEDVRYIGINTPESTPNQPLECFGHEASAANRALVEGRSVRLSFGPERRDDYGRLLAYVRASGVAVNAELVRRGYARTLTIAPNDALAPTLARLEAAAGRVGRGLWGACDA
jgi:micrococcal nuclease